VNFYAPILRIHRRRICWDTKEKLMSIRANLIFPLERIHTGYRSIAFSCLAAMLFCAKVEAQPVGDVYIAGNTWKEWQWGGCPVDEMIALDTVDNTIYLTWTYAPRLSYLRRSYYNSFNPQAGWAYAEPGCWMFPGVSDHQFHTLMVKDAVGGLGDVEFGLESMDPRLKTLRAWWEPDSFRSMPLDTLFGPWEWVDRRAISPGGAVSVIGVDGHTKIFYYGRYQTDPYVFSGWQFVDTLSHGFYNVAASPVSERVAICYDKAKNVQNHHYAYSWDCDFFLLSSPDGVEWDWQDRTNVTHFDNINPLRPAADADLLVDHNDRIHLAFTTWEVLVDSITPESTKVNPFMTHIWHWSEASDSFSLIAENWIHQPPP